MQFLSLLSNLIYPLSVIGFCNMDPTGEVLPHHPILVAAFLNLIVVPISTHKTVRLLWDTAKRLLIK